MSVKQVTYVLATKDGLSGKLKEISQMSDKTYNKLTAGQRGFNEQVRSGGEQVSSLTGGLQRMLGTYMTIGAGIMFARNSLNKWNEQAQAEAQVMQGIASTNMAAGKSFEYLTKAASDLQKRPCLAMRAFCKT